MFKYFYKNIKWGAGGHKLKNKDIKRDNNYYYL